MPTQLRTAATLAALAIALGAFGAHGLEKTFAAVSEKAADWWQTAVFYHLTHAIALYAIAARGPNHFPKAGWNLLLTGILIFSGTLYIMALTGITKLGIITPLGGLSLIIGWILVAKKA